MQMVAAIANKSEEEKKNDNLDVIYHVSLVFQEGRDKNLSLF